MSKTKQKKLAIKGAILLAALFAVGLIMLGYVDHTALAVSGLPLVGFAGALAADRNTLQRSGDTVVLGVATGVTIYAGAIVARNASGYATPGAVATTLRFIGRASEKVVNAGADGTMSIAVEKGIFKFGNYASDLVTIADVGNDCYIYDDYQVAKTSATSTRSVAGKVFAVDSDGVWVDMRA
jgi:hypothetical protein